jgi:hypothetical protein
MHCEETRVRAELHVAIINELHITSSPTGHRACDTADRAFANDRAASIGRLAAAVRLAPAARALFGRLGDLYLLRARTRKSGQGRTARGPGNPRKPHRVRFYARGVSIVDDRGDAVGRRPTATAARGSMGGQPLFFGRDRLRDLFALASSAKQACCADTGQDAA